MWHILHLAALPAAFLLGVFCVLTAIMLYPGEEGKIQSKFEDFWIRVDDYKQLALSRHAAFMTQVAKLETRFLDRIFGDKLISGHALAVSFCFAYSMWCIDSIYEFYRSPLRQNYIEPVVLLIGSLIVGAALIFIRRRHVLRRGVTITLLLVFVIWQLSNSPPRHRTDWILRAFIAGFGGFACDVLFIALTRQLLRWTGQMTSSLQVLATVILNLMIALFLTSPVLIEHHVYLGSFGPDTLVMVGVSNLFDAALALLFVVLSGTLLVHRALWPLLTRTLFRMADIGTKGRRGILLTVGLSLLGWSGVKLPELLRELLKALGKG